MVRNFQTKYDTTIIGAGISGLSAAYILTRDPRQRVILLEANPQAGGKIQTELHQGYLIERGPITMSAHAEELLQFCHALDLSLLNAASQNRYILQGGQLKKVSDSPWEMLTTNLISVRQKLRLLLTHPPARLKQQALYELLGPALAPIYALPENQQNKTLGITFPNGMGELVEALQASLPEGVLQLSCPVRQILKTVQGYTLLLKDGRQIKTRSVIIATPANTGSRLLASLLPESGILSQIPHLSLNVIHLAYPASEIPHPINGVGFLVAQSEQTDLLSCLWSSSLFPNRAPANQHLFTCTIRARKQSDEEILDGLNREFSRMFNAPHLIPNYFRLSRNDLAIPRYYQGHREKMAALDSLLSANHPGLFLAGNYLHGVSLNRCVRSGIHAARRAQGFLMKTE